MWTSDVQSKIFTRIKAEGTKQLKKTYPDIYFTTSSKSRADPKFPTVYVRELAGAERGQTLDGTSVNAFICSFQIEVTDNIDDTRARKVANVIYGIMKSMAFQTMGTPIQDNDANSYRNIARYQRIIGYNDLI